MKYREWKVRYRNAEVGYTIAYSRPQGCLSAAALGQKQSIVIEASRGTDEHMSCDCPEAPC